MILVDPRVGSKQYVEPLARAAKCRVRLAKPMLCAGDVCFDGNGPDGPITVGVEIKKVRDFLGSMRSGRMAGEQIVRMSDVYDLSFVVIEGMFKPGQNDLLLSYAGKTRGWEPLSLAAKEAGDKFCFKYGEMFKHALSLSIRKNVIVLRSSNEAETVAQIAHSYAWFQREWDEHNSTDPIKLQTEVVFTKVTLLRKMAAELPGIGWTRSRAVEKAFSSVQAMVNAPIESWVRIDGIGEKTARRVHAALREA